MKQNKIMRAMFSVTSVIILSKLLGFVKQMISASVYGASLETDMIALSEGLVGNLRYVIVNTILTSFVSIYIHIKEEDEEESRCYAADTIKAFSTIIGILALLLWIGAPWISRIIAPTYSGEHSAQLAGYLRLFSPLLLVFVLIAVFHALLDANKRFIPGQLEGINQSIWLILLILCFHQTLGVKTLAVAFIVHTVWNALFLGVFSHQYWRVSFGNPFKKTAVQKMLRMSAPLLFGYAVVFVNQQVGKVLVSGLAEGTVTAMNYASTLSNLVGTLISTIASILFPYITTQIAKNDHRAAAELATRSGVLLVGLFLPVSIITIVCAKDIVMIAFGRGAFDENNVTIASHALAGYAVCFAPFALREVFSRFQYGYQDSKRPMINSTLGILINILLSIMLCPSMGVFGVTLASSVSVCICGVMNLISARHNNEHLEMTPFLKSVPFLLLGGAVCIGTAMWTLSKLQMDNALIRFLLVTVISGGAYFVVFAPVLIRTIRKS